MRKDQERLETLARYCLSRRRALGLSSEAFAAKAGVNRSVINRIECAHGTPHFWNLISICDALGASIDDALGRRP